MSQVALFAPFLYMTKKRYIAPPPPQTFRVRRVKESYAFILSMEKIGILPIEVVHMILDHMVDICYKCDRCDTYIVVGKQSYVVVLNTAYCSEYCRVTSMRDQ
jgi:hypothetical protein